MSMTTTARRHAPERIEYRVYFALMYPFVLALSVVNRMFARSFSVRYTDDRARSGNVFDETASSLNSVLPWIYMGR